jgi:hypothetical protein
LPAPSPARTETAPTEKSDAVTRFATATSVFWSPLKSPATIPLRDSPALKFFNVKFPAPSPSPMVTKELVATAKSSFPSPLKSPTADERVPPLTEPVNLICFAAPNEPAPSPKRIETSP